jgi:CRISPR/Cas system-associated endoribonuclease Cas2
MNCQKKSSNQITEFNRRQKRARQYDATAKTYESQISSIKNALKNVGSDETDNILVLSLPKKRILNLNKMSLNQLNKLRTRMHNEQRYVNFCRDKMQKNLKC